MRRSPRGATIGEQGARKRKHNSKGVISVWEMKDRGSLEPCKKSIKGFLSVGVPGPRLVLLSQRSKRSSDVRKMQDEFVVEVTESKK